MGDNYIEKNQNKYLHNIIVIFKKATKKCKQLNYIIFYP